MSKPAAKRTSKRAPGFTGEQKDYLRAFLDDHPTWDRRSVPADLDLKRFPEIDNNKKLAGRIASYFNTLSAGVCASHCESLWHLILRSFCS